MRLYYIEIQNSLGQWVKGSKDYLSCRKAHSAARAVANRPARVLMQMQKLSLKDLSMALQARRS